MNIYKLNKAIALSLSVVVAFPAIAYINPTEEAHKKMDELRRKNNQKKIQQTKVVQSSFEEAIPKMEIYADMSNKIIAQQNPNAANPTIKIEDIKTEESGFITPTKPEISQEVKETQITSSDSTFQSLVLLVAVGAIIYTTYKYELISKAKNALVSGKNRLVTWWHNQEKKENNKDNNTSQK